VLNRLGYLTQTVAPDALDGAVDTLAARLAANPPPAMRGMKAAINGIARGTLDHDDFTVGLEAAHDNAAFREAVASLRRKKIRRAD